MDRIEHCAADECGADLEPMPICFIASPEDIEDFSEVWAKLNRSPSVLIPYRHSPPTIIRCRVPLWSEPCN